jgi:hypothetical protein
LRSLWHRELKYARGVLLANSPHREGLARAAKVATKPLATMPRVFVVLGSRQSCGTPGRGAPPDPITDLLALRRTVPQCDEDSRWRGG